MERPAEMAVCTGQFRFNTIDELVETTDYSLETTRMIASELYHHAITKNPPVPPEWAQHVVTATLPDTELSQMYSTWYVAANEADRTHTHRVQDHFWG